MASPTQAVDLCWKEIFISCDTPNVLTWVVWISRRKLLCNRLLLGIKTAQALEYLDSLTLLMAWPDPIKNRRPRKPNSVQIAPLLHIVPDILNFVQKLKGLASRTPLATNSLDPWIQIDICKPVCLIQTKSHAMEPLLLYFWKIPYIFAQCAMGTSPFLRWWWFETIWHRNSSWRPAKLPAS